MNRKILVGVSTLLLTGALSGCSQVHFGKNAITVDSKKAEPQKKGQVKKQSSQDKSVPKKKKAAKKKVEKKDRDKKKTKKIVKTKWDKNKTKKLKVAVKKWSRTVEQNYRFYDGVHPLNTKNGSTYPAVFKQHSFVLNKQTIKIGYSPLGKDKYQYNVVAIANADFDAWHNTYLFCLKKNKPVILFDQSKQGTLVIVKKINDHVLNKAFTKIYQQ